MSFGKWAISFGALCGCAWGGPGFAHSPLVECPPADVSSPPVYMSLVESVRAEQVERAFQLVPLLVTLKWIHPECYARVVEWLDMRLSDDLVVEDAEGGRQVTPRLVTLMKFDPQSHADLERVIGVIKFLSGDSKMQINRSAFRTHIQTDIEPRPGVSEGLCSWLVSSAKAIFNSDPGGKVAGDGGAWDMQSR
jgi:hypothetical protein